MLRPHSYACGTWTAPGDAAQEIVGPVTGQVIAQAGGAALDMQAMLDHARLVGGPALRAMGFHDRARMIKALAGYLDTHKEQLYALNPLTGATRRDGWVDIDGGIGTMGLFAAKGRREMPDGHVYIDGEVEALSRKGTFLGQHIAVPLFDQRLGYRQHSPFRHPRPTLRPGIAQDQNCVWRHLKIFIFDGGFHVWIAIKDQCRALVLVIFRITGRRLDHSPIGTKIAAQHGK